MTDDIRTLVSEYLMQLNDGRVVYDVFLPGQIHPVGSVANTADARWRIWGRSDTTYETLAEAVAVLASEHLDTIPVDETTTATVKVVDDTLGAEVVTIVISHGDTVARLTGPLRYVYWMVMHVDAALARISRPGLSYEPPGIVDQRPVEEGRNDDG